MSSSRSGASAQPLADGLRPVKHDKPLWTDQRIAAIIKEIAHNDLPDMRTQSVTTFQAEQLMKRVRLDYEAAFADAEEKARQRIAELEAKCLQLEARSINLGMTDEMQRNELAEKDNLVAELTAQLAECNKSLAGHVWAYNVPDDDIGGDNE